MKTLNDISQWLKDIKTERKWRKIERRRKQLRSELAERIQLKEWDGLTYIAVDGVPMLRATYCNRTAFPRCTKCATRLWTTKWSKTMAANDKFNAERSVRVKARNERIVARFAELRKTLTKRSCRNLYGIIGKEYGVSLCTVRNAVISAGLVKTGTIKTKD